jgi:hypothetical protein
MQPYFVLKLLKGFVKGTGHIDRLSCVSHDLVSDFLNLPEPAVHRLELLPEMDTAA